MDSTNPNPKNIPDDDLTLQNYQDDLDTSSSAKDYFITEAGDITEELGVSPAAFKAELDRYVVTDSEGGDDQVREELEDD